ncbi:MAG: class I SAM-dependent methyltransferase [Gemmatimonadetes bacterium]|nr:class I SAM-dependent methyltransferase [Gemmatimonadota bacterium]
MREGEGSRTAERVAARRAVHQILDDPVVFADPLAWAVLRPAAAQRLREDPRQLDRSPAGRFLRAFLAARSRLAEDRLRDAVARGVRQYVVVGAGLDTFAYRNPHADAGLRVFEVDHPATQAVKRARLADAGVSVPESVAFVPADLASVPLGAALRGTGFDPSTPSFFSWLGVVPYLERQAIRATLESVASLPAEATLVFDYGAPPPWYRWLTRLALRRMGERVAAAGEPWKTFFRPAELLRELHGAGFRSVEDLGPGELNRRYFAGRRDGLRVGGVGHVVVAANR